MATFIIGLVILFGGAALYGKFCENVFGPDDRETPAYSKQDGVDYVPMKTWRNSLINLLNIDPDRQRHRRFHARLFFRHDLHERRRHADA